MKRLVLIAALALSACNQQHATSAAAPAAQTLTPQSLPTFFDCLRERGQTIVAAHRGGPAPGFAENSIDTFAHTLTQAPAMLEIDIARTSDGALVLMHDDTLDRTTNGHGDVDATSLEAFRALALRDDDGAELAAHPPTFAEALQWAAGKTVLELDVKRGVSYEDVVAAVRAANAADRVIFITYSVPAAIRVHGLAPELMISTTIESERDLDALERAGVDLNRILAWTGIEEPNSTLNVALAQRGVEAMFGTLGGRESWDAKFAAEGRDQYAAFAETGLSVIATDRAPEASRALDDADGEPGLAALQCVSAR